MELRGEQRALSWTMSGSSLPGGTFSSSGTIDRLFSEQREVSARVNAQTDLSAYNDLTMPNYGLELLGNLKTDINAFGSLKEWKQLRLTGTCRSDNLTLIDPSWSVDTVSLAMDLLLDGHDVRPGLDGGEELGARRDGGGGGSGARVRADLLGLRAGLQGMLEDLNALSGVEGAADSADQLLRLPREHRTHDDGQRADAPRG